MAEREAELDLSGPLGLLLWVGLSFLAAYIGSAFTRMSLNDWYVALEKPGWTPPGRVFGLVWSTIYLLMGVGAWIAWRHRGLKGAAFPLRLFLLQLVLNAGWSALFFGLRSPGLAFGDIVVLWVLILATTVSFWRVVPAAGLLLVPYLIWVLFATALNFSIWRLNA